MSEMEAAEQIRPITAAEYHRMLDAGILHEREPVELLDGRLIAMPPEGPLHAGVVTQLNVQLVRRFADRAAVRPGNPLALDNLSEPQPDFALVRADLVYFRSHPRPNDVFLVVEVSSTSLEYDRRRKLSAYARAGIREYWIVDLVNRRVETYADPHDLGYAQTRIAERGESLAPRAFPNDAIEISAFLP